MTHPRLQSEILSQQNNTLSFKKFFVDLHLLDNSFWSLVYYKKQVHLFRSFNGFYKHKLVKSIVYRERDRDREKRERKREGEKGAKNIDFYITFEKRNFHRL